MLFAHIDVIDGNLDYKKDCFVATEDQRVVYLGQQEPEGDFGETYDGRGKLLMSGLYNAHAHSTMTLLRGYAENMALQDWLFNAVFPFEDLITNESALPATQLAIAEMLRFGVVSFSDMYFFDDPRAQAVLDSGIKCNLCRSISSFDPEQHYRDHDAFAVNEHLIDDLHGAGRAACWWTCASIPSTPPHRAWCRRLPPIPRSAALACRCMCPRPRARWRSARGATTE